MTRVLVVHHDPDRTGKVLEARHVNGHRVGLTATGLIEPGDSRKRGETFDKRAERRDGDDRVNVCDPIRDHDGVDGAISQDPVGNMQSIICAREVRFQRAHYDTTT